MDTLELNYPEGDVPPEGYRAIPYWDSETPPSKKQKRSAAKAAKAEAKRQKKSDTPKKSAFDLSSLNETERKIVDFLNERGSSHPDEMTSLGIPVHILSSTLMMLELRGITEAKPGGFYILKN